MTENKIYQEAAKAHTDKFREIMPHANEHDVKHAFICGALFAHAAREKEIADAHNAAIDKALNQLKIDVFYREVDIKKIIESIEKLKI
jgi:hypothetical protein